MSKRLLLTGSAGFMGSHTVEHILKNTDWEIIGLDSFRHKGDSERVIQDKRYIVYGCDLAAPISHRLASKIGEVNYIINMASESDVGRSIDDPEDFVKNNYNLALYMLQFARRQKKLEKYIQISTDEVFGAALEGHNHTEWEHHLPSNPYSASKSAQTQLAIAWWRTYNIPLIITQCFSMDMQLLMENGLKKYEDIKVGDKVWTLDKNENLILTEVLEKIIMPSNGKMVEIKTNKINQLVTQNHRIIHKKCKGKPRRWGKLEEFRADSLLKMKGRVRIPTCGVWSGEDLNPNYILGEKTAEEMMSLYGWYISEGFNYTRKNKNGFYMVGFGAGSKEQQDEILSLLKTIGGASISGRSVRLNNKRLFKISEEFGHLAENKKIPNFIKKCNKDLLRCFFESAIDGDGNRAFTNKKDKTKQTGLVYYTKSKQLAEDFCEIGMKLGYAVRISKRKTFNPRKTKLSESFIVRFRNYQADIEKNNVKEINYDKDVWCVRTATGQVFVEREGIISLSGQTMNIIGERQDPEKFLPMLIKKINANEKIKIHGTKEYIGKRKYLHARNQADALLFILKNVKPVLYYDCIDKIIKPENFNIVGDVELNNLELAQMVADIMGKFLIYELEDFHKARSGHDRRYSLDGSKIASYGWKAPVDFYTSLEKTIRWTLEREEWLL